MIEFTLGLAVSAHLGLQGNYNAIHPSIMLEYNNYIAGAYYNSERHISKFIGYRYDINDDTNLEFGLVDGYSLMDVTPMAKLNHKQFFISPAYEKSTDSKGLIVGMEWRF